MTISSLRHRRGFTLIEIMVVISIIMILMGVATLPYQYYVQKGYVERARDTVAQEWILAHKAIRNGILYGTGKHADMVMVFEKGKNTISSYLLSGSTYVIGSQSADIKPYRTITLDGGVEILGFSGGFSAGTDKIGYLITPPYGTGAFFTGSTTTLAPIMDGQLVMGYKGAEPGTPRLQTTLLRPYLQ